MIASNGHIRDLPKSQLGVDIEKDFAPQYVTIRAKSKVISTLREKAKGADEILLAPDPDREGEAIAWHLTKVLNGKEDVCRRLVFHEITRTAIQEALQHPHEIDMNKVDAQQARRILDRLVGYQLSPVLWKTVRYGLSAGRVQSVALRLIVDREAEVQAFLPVEYWSIHAAAQTADGRPLELALVAWKEAKPSIGSAAEAEAIVASIGDQPLEVTKRATRRRKRNPAAPFITSTLQQEAFRALRFSSKKTMKVAQELYEGLEVESEGTVGLITYMRTDSTRVADEAIAGVRGFIGSTYGEAYLPNKAQIYKVKGRAQDAHEAVRPTDVQRTPEKMKKYLSPDQLKLYALIWKRFVASQMCPQEQDITTIEALAGEGLFRASGRVIAFDGFTRLYESQEKRNKGTGNGEEELSGKEIAPEILVRLHKGDILAVREYERRQHFTEPPARFTEATLIKTLEERGIGRPSTYATIVSTILTRDYVRREKGRLLPTELGQTVTGLLVSNFERIMSVDFTAHMEEELDAVELGKDKWVNVVREFYLPFRASLDAAEAKTAELKASVQVATGQKCEECAADMVRKFGRNGPFLACSRYPDCRFTQPLSDDEKPHATEHECPECGEMMMIRTGRFGRFLACSRYPDCKTTRPVPVGVTCPEPDCGGALVEKRTRSGRVFFGCERYPKCKYAIWDRPVAQPCEACEHPFVMEKETRKAGPHYACPKCKATFPREAEEEASA